MKEEKDFELLPIKYGKKKNPEDMDEVMEDAREEFDRSLKATEKDLGKLQETRHKDRTIDLGIACCTMALIMALISLKLCFFFLPITQTLWVAFLEALLCLASIIIGAILGVGFALLLSQCIEKRKKKQEDEIDAKESALKEKSLKYKNNIKKIDDALRRQ